jgi:hypothetical protein
MKILNSSIPYSLKVNFGGWKSTKSNKEMFYFHANQYFFSSFLNGVQINVLLYEHLLPKCSSRETDTKDPLAGACDKP